MASQRKCLRILPRTHVPRSKHVGPHDAAGIAIEHDIRARECRAPRIGLDDGHSFHLVCDRVVGVASRDDVDQSFGQASRQRENLGRRIARGQIGGSIEPRARPAGMRRHDDHLGARGSQSRCFGGDRWRQWCDAQSLDVHGSRRRQCVNRHHANDADPHARSIHHNRGSDVGPRDRSVRGDVNEVRSQKRIVRLGRARLQGAPHVAGHLSRARCIHGSEVELVIADGCRRVAHGVVGIDDERALAQIGFHAVQKRIAGIQQQDGASIRCSHRAQVVDEASQQRKPAAPVRWRRWRREGRWFRRWTA